MPEYIEIAGSSWPAVASGTGPWPCPGISKIRVTITGGWSDSMLFEWTDGNCAGKSATFTATYTIDETWEHPVGPFTLVPPTGPGDPGSLTGSCLGIDASMQGAASQFDPPRQSEPKIYPPIGCYYLAGDSIFPNIIISGQYILQTSGCVMVSEDPETWDVEAGEPSVEIYYAGNVGHEIRIYRNWLHGTWLLCVSNSSLPTGHEDYAPHWLVSEGSAPAIEYQMSRNVPVPTGWTRSGDDTLTVRVKIVP